MKRLDILANNLANADTTAYKKEGTTSRTFADEMAIRMKDSSTSDLPTNLGEITYGVHLGQVYTDYTSGSFEVTDNSTDFAIDGNGFFAISFTDKQGNTSVKYTRDGSFTVNTDGYLVTKDGDYVLNATGAMNGDPSESNYIKLDPNAEITVDKLGYISQNDQIVGTLGMVDFDNYDYLEKYGENMYNLLDGGNAIAADCKVEQGVLETSNVNVINEMVNMITIQRAYEAGQKVITSIDETLEKAVNQVGKV
jgi:flagellar basal-body rod protein FlgG